MSVETAFMLRSFIRGICGKPSGVALVVGAIGVLAGVEHLLSTRTKKQRRVRPVSEQKVEVPVPAVVAERVDYFQIRRTKSDLGYTYWVVQGFGKYQGFALHDTWQEAIDDAAGRASGAGTAESLSLEAAAEPAKAEEEELSDVHVRL